MPIPPAVAWDATPNRCLVVNEQWLAHVMGLLERAVHHGYWDANEQDGFDGIMAIQDAFGNPNCEECPVYEPPVGSIMLMGQGSPVEGYVLCDGTEYFRADYSRLFDVIGTAFGAPSGTTFKVPRFNRFVPIGWDIPSSLDIGETLGEETHVLTTPEMPAHTHTVPRSTDGGGGTLLRIGTSVLGANVTSSSTGGGGAHNNMQPSLAVAYFIYVGIPPN